MVVDTRREVSAAADELAERAVGYEPVSPVEQEETGKTEFGHELRG